MVMNLARVRCFVQEMLHNAMRSTWNQIRCFGRKGCLANEWGCASLNYWVSFRVTPLVTNGCRNGLGSYWKGGKDPHPQDFSLTKKTARFTKGQFRPYYREGANREKLTLKKIINKEMIFFTVYLPYKPWKIGVNREKTGTKPWKNRHQKSTIFSPLVCHRLRLLDTKDRKRPYYGHFFGKTHREGSCSKAAGGPY